MGLLEQLDEILSSRLERAVEKERAMRGARLLGPQGRAVVEAILRSTSDAKPAESGEAAPAAKPDATPTR